jgi:hypothetical protein
MCVFISLCKIILLQQNIVNLKFKGPKKFFKLWRTSIIQIKKKTFTNSLLKKLVLLLLVWYAVSCHTITVTNYHFMWCSIVINVIFSTCFGSIICYIGKFYFEDFLNCNFKLFGEKCMEIITTGLIFFCIMNYQGFWNNQANLHEFFFPGMYIKTKIQNIMKFRIVEFLINQVLLYIELRIILILKHLCLESILRHIFLLKQACIYEFTSKYFCKYSTYSENSLLMFPCSM